MFFVIFIIVKNLKKDKCRIREMMRLKFYKAIRFSLKAYSDLIILMQITEYVKKNHIIPKKVSFKTMNSFFNQQFLNKTFYTQ